MRERATRERMRAREKVTETKRAKGRETERQEEREVCGERQEERKRPFETGAKVKAELRYAAQARKRSYGDLDTS